MKQKLLYTFIIVLLLINVGLLVLLIKKPHENRKGLNRNFLMIQLDFNKEQKRQFFELDKTHRFEMRRIDESVRPLKGKLFHSFGKKNFELQSITQQIGELESQKDQELFYFFSKVRNLCNEQQKETFDKIINQVLKGGKSGHVNHFNQDENLPPPGERKLPPPRH